MLALWFFVTLYDAKDGSLLASVLGTSFFEKVDPRYDVVVAFDQDNLVVAAHHAFEDVDEVKVLIAYDPDRLTIEFEPIVALWEVHMAVDHGMLTYIISDVYQINDEDDLLLLKTSGDKDAVVVSEVSVSFVWDTKVVSLWLSIMM